MNRNEQKNNEWLQNLLKKPEDGKKRRWPLHYILLIGGVGVVLMFIANLLTNPVEDAANSSPIYQEDQEEKPAFGSKTSKISAESYSMDDYEIRYENQLRDVLEQIVGLSDVSIMINLAETERHVYEKNTNTKEQSTNETDREGGTRKVDDMSRDEQLVIIRSGDAEEPVLIHKEKPHIRGVLVVAKGVENVQIKGWVVEAVSRVLDVPTHRVSVLPKKKSKEDL